MKRLNNKFLSLVLLILVFLGIVLTVMLTPSPMTIVFDVLLLVFVPGFLISRILKMNLLNDISGNLATYTVWGLVYNLFFCLVAILLNATITGFLFVYSITFVCFLVFGLFYLLWVLPDSDLRIDLKGILKIDNLILLPLGFVLMSVLIVVSQLGTNFTGDPLYHLSIMRRAVEGLPMSIDNLGEVKGYFHISYGLPILHIFLSLVSKITRTNIFELYRTIPVAFDLLIFLAWYWLFRIILPSRQSTITVFFLFIFYHFGKNGYIFTRSAVPDTFAGLIMLPLALGMAVKYVFDKTTNAKHLILLSLLLITMGLVHWTQYFYYLLALGLLIFVYVLLKLPKFDWPIVKKMLLALATNWIIIVPILIFIQFKQSALADRISELQIVKKASNNDRFYKFSALVQLSYVFLPVVGLFIRKYPKLVLILAVFIAGPIIYNVPGLLELTRRYLSHVFVNRLYTNLGEWPYVIWGLLISFLLVLIDRLITRITVGKNWLRYSLDLVVGFLFFGIFFLQVKYEKLERVYESVLSKSVADWLANNYLWLIPAVVFATFVIYIVQKYNKTILGVFTFTDIKNGTTNLFLTLIVLVFFMVPCQGNLSYYFKKEFANTTLFNRVIDPANEIINPQKFGGYETIEFIRKNIPPKSVFDTNTKANYTLATLVDVHMASYDFNPDPTLAYREVYNYSLPIEEKLRLVKKGNIDYLIYVYPDNNRVTPFDQYSQYFTKIYDSKAAIFKVNKITIESDP